jgi:hypothetical protein
MNTQISPGRFINWVEGVWPNDGGGSEKLRVETQLLVPLENPLDILQRYEQQLFLFRIIMFRF